MDGLDLNYVIYNFATNLDPAFNIYSEHSAAPCRTGLFDSMADPATTDLPADDVDSSSDEDFNPAAQVEDESASSSESDGEANTAVKPTKRKGAKKSKAVEIDVELDSGDEETIQERQKKKRRKGKGKGVAQDGQDFVFSDEGGDGGFIKTRAQRRAEVKERKPLAGIEGATADVDAIWARLSSAPFGRAPGSVLGEKDIGEQRQENKENINGQQTSHKEEYITIKRTYEFAGEVKTEQRRVPTHSAEAKVYLEEQAAKGSKSEGDAPANAEAEKAPLRRPLKRPNRFEPNPEGMVKGLPDKLQLRWPRTTDEDGRPLAGVKGSAGKKPAIASAKAKPADKLTTVDKSRMDWAGFVDKEGIGKELDEYGRAKKNFLERNEFLARTDAKREEAGHDARTRQREQQQAG